MRSIEIHNGDRKEIQQELDLAKNRWGGEGGKSGIAQIKTPLLTTTERIQIQDHEKIGWPEWQSMDREKQWDLSDRVGFLLRRPMRISPEEQQGN